MRNKLILLLVFISLLVVVQAQGLPTQVNANTNIGYDIRYPEYSLARVNTTFVLHTHVYNRSTGLPLDNSSVACFLHLYTPDGNQQSSMKLDFEREPFPIGEFEKTILGTNFSFLGTYAYVIQCNSTVFGGFASGIFDVTYSGRGIDVSESLLVFLLLVLYLVIIVAILWFTSRIPDGDSTDDLGQLIGINYVKHLRPVMYGLVYVLGVLFFFLLANMSFAYLPDTLLAQTFFVMYRVGFLVGIILVPLRVIYLFIEIFNDIQKQKLLNEGFGGHGQEI
jgi:hypothetical protein